MNLEAWQLAGYDQAHFFAGIGGWPLALRLAGYPDLHCWTGSCPCQPFSVAGKRKGTDDVRHLWPTWFPLIAECKPSIIFGEQVASKDGREWLARVRADLEALGYVVGAADLCAAGIRAPHIRQRLYWGAWLADADSTGENERPSGREQSLRNEDNGYDRLADTQSEQRNGSRAEGNRWTESTDSGADGRMADTEHDDRWAIFSGREPEGRDAHQWSARGLVYTQRQGLEGYSGHGNDGNQSGRLNAQPSGSTSPASPTGFWDNYDLIGCADGKARRIEPGTFPLANGVSRRMDKLRGYGNAIVPELAAVFIKSFMEAL